MKIAIALLAGTLAAGAATAQVVPAKFGLDDLDEEEVNQIAQLVDGLAQVEVVMQHCVEPQNYDRRLREKIEDCIHEESIQRVQRFFEDRMQLHDAAFDKATCQKPELQERFPSFLEDMESALWKIGLMCTLCLFC